MEFHDTTTILIIIFVIIALSAIVSYIVYDLTKYKQTVDNALNTEKESRVSNVKTIVNQVNDTNDDMSIQVSSSLTSLGTDIDRFKSAFNVNAKEVNLVKPLNVNEKAGLSICGTEQCIQIPDKFGNTFLTTLTQDKSIVMDAPVRVDKKGPKKIQFANDTSTTRHIVLWETADNEHQYFGMGLSQTSLKYQVSTQQCSHVFSTGTGTNSSKELMRINGQGFVGIGVSEPRAPLHIDGGDDKTNYSTFMLTRTDQTKIPTAFSISLGDGQGLVNMMAGAYSISGVHKYHSTRGASKITLHDGIIAFFTGGVQGVKDNNVTWREVMRLSNDNVGIKVTEPKHPLHVGGIIAANGFIQPTDAVEPMIERQLDPTKTMDRYGLAHDKLSKKLRLYMSGAEGTSSVSISKATSANTYDELVTVQSSGRVGIGLTNPLDALDVNGYISARNGMFIGRSLKNEDAVMKVGIARTENGHSYIDLIGDTTYSQYGTRLIRYGGPNGWSRIEHNGTGPLDILTNHAAPIYIRSNNKRRITIHPDGKIEIDGSEQGIYLSGDVSIKGNLNVSGTVTSSQK